MHITVVMSVELPARGDSAVVEPLIVAGGQHARRTAAQAASREYEHPVLSCPSCASTSLQRQGGGTRQLRTRFGRVALRRRRLQCEACCRLVRPAEPFIASAGGGRECDDSVAGGGHPGRQFMAVSDGHRRAARVVWGGDQRRMGQADDQCRRTH